MLARVIVATLALGLLVLAAPAPLSPASDAAANCVEVNGSCENPCYDANAAYNDVRHTAGVEDKTPDLYCLA